MERQLKEYILKLYWTSHFCSYKWCGNIENGLLLLLISGYVDDEEEAKALTSELPYTFTQSFIHVHRLVSPWPLLEEDRVSELRRNNAECYVEQRVNIKFLTKLGKSATET